MQFYQQLTIIVNLLNQEPFLFSQPTEKLHTIDAAQW